MKTRRSNALCQGRRNDGFTVAEFVAASAILFIVLVGILGAVDFAGASTRMANMRQAGVDLANQQIEQDRNIPWSSLGVTYGSGYVGNPAGIVPAVQTTTTLNGTFTINTSITWVLDRSQTTPMASYKRLTVTVSWTTPSPGGSVSVVTNVFGQGSAVANAGDVLVTACDVENPSKRTPGCMINLDPYGSGSIMVATTDSDGMAVWDSVPVGVATFPTTINPSYLVDATGLGSPSIHTGFQDLGFIYTQVPRTLSVHVKTTALPNAPAGTVVTLKDSVSHAGVGPDVFTATVLGSDGMAYFDPGHGTTLGRPGLWLSTGYSLSAAYGGAKSPTSTMSLPNGCPVANTGPELTIPDPPTIVVSMKVSSTGAALTGKSMTVTVKDPGGATLSGSGGTYTDSATFPVTTAGNYTVTVTGVNGFADSTYTFAANASGVGQACVVPMQPLFVVFVQDTLDSSGISTASVRVWTGSTYLTTTGGQNPGITPASGQVAFVIPSDASYNVSATVNGINYYGTPNPISLTAGSPPLTPYVISVTPGTLAVTVGGVGPPTAGTVIALYDSYGNYVTKLNATQAAPTVTFTDVCPGTYWVAACKSTFVIPPTKPGTTSGTVRTLQITSPVAASTTTTFSITPP